MNKENSQGIDYILHLDNHLPPYMSKSVDVEMSQKFTDQISERKDKAEGKHYEHSILHDQ